MSSINFIELTLKDNDGKRILINVDAIEAITSYGYNACIQCKNSRPGESRYIVEESYEDLIKILYS